MERQGPHGTRLRRSVGGFQGLHLSGSLLLDTSVVIWTFQGEGRISPRAKRALEASAQSLFVSVVSLWEIVLKAQSGKLNLNFGLRVAIEDICKDPSWSILPLHAEILLTVMDLPMLHRDPFDRMLVAQAQNDGLTIVTPDSHIRKYDVQTLW